MSNAALKQDPGGQTPTAPEPDQSLLDDLKAQATAKYSVKDYDAAAELYSQATELQDRLNGEMSPLNADLLYAYGRCLYHLAVKKSDLLGSKLPGEEVEGASSAKNKKKGDQRERTASTGGTKRIDEEVVSEIVQENSSKKEPESSNKPFVFTGDENFTDSEEDDAVEDEDEEPEDDFANAYEILDTSRILLRKRLEAEESADAKGKSTTDSTELRNLKERLADTHDLQAEILLEGERFPQAVDDLRAALDLKLALFPQENSLIAEAHYKLSLALEFSSVTREKDENGEPKPGTSGTIDEAMREEAAKQMECAIASCELRISKEKARLGTPEQTASKAEIEDVKEMVKEMQDRVSRRFA